MFTQALARRSENLDSHHAGLVLKMRALERCEMANIAKPFCDRHQIIKIKNLRGINRCRECVNEKRKERILNNPEYYKNKRKEYSQRASVKARQQLFLKADREKNPDKHKEYSINFRERNQEIIAIKRKIRPYKISIDQYIDMVQKSENKCDICRNEEEIMFKGKRRRLSLDHDHSNNKVRGLLCGGCNAGLGHFKDDINRLQSAIDYLKKNKE